MKKKNQSFENLFLNPNKPSEKDKERVEACVRVCEGVSTFKLKSLRCGELNWLFMDMKANKERIEACLKACQSMETSELQALPAGVLKCAIRDWDKGDAE